MRPDTQVFPGFSLSARKEGKVGIQPSCSVFGKGPFGELSSKSEGRGSSELCSTVSPSTHSVCSNIAQFGEIENKGSIVASKPRAEGDMLPEFRKHINKCCTIAARQAAEGDMLKKLNKHENPKV